MRVPRLPRSGWVLAALLAERDAPFVSADGHRCGETRGSQIDHITPPRLRWRRNDGSQLRLFARTTTVTRRRSGIGYGRSRGKAGVERAGAGKRQNREEARRPRKGRGAQTSNAAPKAPIADPDSIAGATDLPGTAEQRAFVRRESDLDTIAALWSPGAREKAKLAAMEWNGMEWNGMDWTTDELTQIQFTSQPAGLQCIVSRNSALLQSCRRRLTEHLDSPCRSHDAICLVTKALSSHSARPSGRYCPAPQAADASLEPPPCPSHSEGITSVGRRHPAASRAQFAAAVAVRRRRNRACGSSASRMRSEPDCSGGCIDAGMTFSHSAVAAITRSVVSLGCGGMNRMRVTPRRRSRRSRSARVVVVP